MRMCKVFEEDYVAVSCIGECCQHAHTLKESDCAKKPSYFRDLAAAQVANGYNVADVA